MDQDFLELSEKLVQMIEGEKRKIYESFVNDHPEKEEFLKL